MGTPESIKSLIQSFTKSEDGSVIEAKVIAVGPLRVQATNDDKLILNAGSLVVPRHLTDYTACMSYFLDKGTIAAYTEGDGRHNHGSSGNHIHTDGAHDGHISGDGAHEHSGGEHVHTAEGPHTHHLISFSLKNGTFTVYNALKVGEIVYLLRYNDGKKYYILDRKEA